MNSKSKSLNLQSNIGSFIPIYGLNKETQIFEAVASGFILRYKSLCYLITAGHTFYGVHEQISYSLNNVINTFDFEDGVLEYLETPCATPLLQGYISDIAAMKLPLGLEGLELSLNLPDYLEEMKYAGFTPHQEDPSCTFITLEGKHTTKQDFDVGWVQDADGQGRTCRIYNCRRFSDLELNLGEGNSGGAIIQKSTNKVIGMLIKGPRKMNVEGDLMVSYLFLTSREIATKLDALVG